MSPGSGRIDRLMEAVTLASARRSGWTLMLALACLIGAWTYASKLQIRGDFVELLPSDSATAKRFREALSRKTQSGGSTLLVVVDSPDPGANQRLIDAVEKKVRALPPDLHFHVEHGPGDAREFFRRYRWLYATTDDLERAECELFWEKSRNLPGDLGLEDDCGPEVKDGGGGSAKGDQKKGLSAIQAELEARVREVDRFPTGYYRTESGDHYALLLRSPSAGMGDFSTDRLLAEVRKVVDSIRPEAFHPKASIGLGGDIPNAVAEREALVHDVTLVSTCAIVLIFTSIIVYFRSVLSLCMIGLCVTTGCGFAFALAMAAYGKLNAATSFLGAIVFGNGINYSIVYLARYHELRSQGEALEPALVSAARDCRRATWLASLAAAGAYAALLVTSFRGFREFGLIGGSGMLFCWLSTFVILPAAVAKLSRHPKPWKQRDRIGALERLARIARGRPVPILIAALCLTAAAVARLPGYLVDPWESDFSKLKSRSSHVSGAGRWSQKANHIFQSRGSPMLVLAEHEGEAPALSDAILTRDKERHGGRFIQRIETIDDYLGGPPEVVAKKLEILGRIREHIDWLLPRISAEDRSIAEDWRPPEGLEPPRPRDLPATLLGRFQERDGRVGTPLYVHLKPGISQSNGKNLLAVSDILEGVRLPSGSPPPNLSRATIFADMIRSLERDSPIATLAALAAVLLVSVLMTRRWLSAAAVLGSLVAGVAWTVGGAAWLDVRLNFLNFVALPLTFGIGVEYAINVYERTRVTGDVVQGVRSVGGAVALCSLTTIIGYASLLFSDNLALQSLGRYAVVGEIACLTTALLVLPAFLNLRASPK